MPDETDIQKLLRLKRYEQPSPDYFEKFLRDFHHRQRAELLRQPVWKIAFERVEAFFSEQSMGRYAYTVATAMVLLFAGITSFHILNNGGSAPAGIAQLQKDSRVETAAAPSDVAAQNSLALGNPHIQLPGVNLQPQWSGQFTQPRYVIDARPVSYERPFSF